jgi:GTP-binding protein
MPLPRIAIVGRPNVGKSSIMNMIAATKVSIVDPTAGTTRDRVTAIVDLDPPVRTRGDVLQKTRPVEVVDTGGFGVYVVDGGRFDEIGNDLARLTGDIEFQIRQAVEGADLILFVVDTQAGVTPADQQIARLLREGVFAKRRRKIAGEAEMKAEQLQDDKPRKAPPIRVVANKVDGQRWEAHAAEISSLGFGEPIMLSAMNNYMRREFLDSVYLALPETQDDTIARPHADMLLAIIGKRNSGKSTLINTLVGEQRVIASEIPGTTRDAVDVSIPFEGKTIVAIDTAGLRRKRSFQNMIETFAFDRLKRSIDRCDVVMLMLDATEAVSQVDEQLAMLAQKAFRPAVIVVNKWDLVEGQRDQRGKVITTKTYEDYIRTELRGLWYAPISFISAQSNRNVRDTMRLALELRQQSASRVTTGKLNRLVRGVLDKRGPSDRLGRFAKVYYVAQTGVEPPTITLVVNHPDMFTPNYLRFLSNRFREELPFGEVPIRIVVRARRQREDDLVSAEEGGTGHTIRIARGRKGVEEGLAGRRLQATSSDIEGDDGLGDLWLSDEMSAAVDMDQFDVNSDAKAFGSDDEPEDDGPVQMDDRRARRGKGEKQHASRSERKARDEDSAPQRQGWQADEGSDEDLTEDDSSAESHEEVEAPRSDRAAKGKAASTPTKPLAKPASKPAAKKAVKKPAAKKAATKKTPAKKTSPKKPTAKATTSKKPAAKGPSKKASKKSTKK